MKRSPSLLESHLEKVSWQVLDEYREVVKDLIRRRSGVYALYSGRRLYYVGLASNLMGRVKSHLRDRHHGAWDRFSVYLTSTDGHIKELESLVLRIVGPSGNRVAGRLAGSKNLHPILNRRAKAVDEDRRAILLGGAVADRRRRRKSTTFKGSSALSGIVDHGLRLRATYKGKRYSAVLRPDGRIRFHGRVYASPSAAGTAVIRHPCNGWHLWHFRDGNGQWVRLLALRGGAWA